MPPSGSRSTTEAVRPAPATARAMAATSVRIDSEPGYRIYFGRDGGTLIVLLGGGTKKRQHEDIEAARRLWRDYHRRRSQEE